MSLWLPPLIRLAGFGGEWKRYQETLYEIFRRDFIGSQVSYGGLRLGLKRHPMIEGKEATFWHLISEGQMEQERIPDLRRCERIAWPKPIIERAGSDPAIKVWENERKGEKRVCLWLEEEDYLVVLALRKDYVLLWTAYLVIEEHRKRKLRQEYEAFCSAEKSPQKG